MYERTLTMRNTARNIFKEEFLNAPLNGQISFLKQTFKKYMNVLGSINEIDSFEL
jgi:hypothetical protein